MKTNKTTSIFQFWKNDLLSGFLVFLIALPLSLGIAKASGFPASMGILTAMIGGLAVSLFPKVSALSIKGPAAGLITICAGAIAEFTSIDAAQNALSHLAGILIIVAITQIIMGYLKFGSLADLFPHSAVHGMLAAIGIIIIAKQIPVLLGDDPLLYKGESPLELLRDIPKFIQNAHPHIALIGLIGLLVLFVLPYVPFKKIRQIPAPMVVLILTVPLSLAWHLKTSEPDYALVKIGNFWGSIHFAPRFNMIGTWTFWKYVVMFLFVNSLESLLTVKAVDDLDPMHRKTNPNIDLIALGVGNAFSGLLGGMPMISEVVRSSANIGFGGKSRGSNFFHGLFLLISMIILVPAIELIPNTALAAMLIFAGYRLSSPKEFIQTYKLGKEQLVIFLMTIIVTLSTDLLLGVGVGIMTKLIFHIFSGAPLNSLFTSKRNQIDTDNSITIEILESALFTNILTYKRIFDELPKTKSVIVDFSNCALVDNPFIEFIEHIKQDWNEQGRELDIIGLIEMVPFSKHPLSTRRRKELQP